LSRHPDGPPDEPTDLLDNAMSIPIVNAGVSRLQRVLGPSCLASLVILLLLTILLRKWIHLPPLGIIGALIIIWMLILGALVRFRNDALDSEPDSRESIDSQK